MDEIDPKIKKTNGGWEVDYDKNAPVIIRGQPTKKDPNVEVDMGLRLVPVRIRYKDGGKFTEEQVKSGIETLQKNGCKLCKSSEKTLAIFMNNILEKEGIQGNPSSSSGEGIDASNKSLFGFRERLFLRTNDSRILDGRRPILSRLLNNGEEDGAGTGKKRRALFSLSELRKLRPRIRDIFTIEL